MFTEAEREKMERRLAREISRATACNMNNLKWRALFRRLHELEVGQIRWKFVRDHRVFLQFVPGPSQLLDDRLGDVLPSPYAEYREIDWIEIPDPDAELSAELRAMSKRLPWKMTEGGLRVVAYEWPAAAGGSTHPGDATP